MRLNQVVLESILLLMVFPVCAYGQFLQHQLFPHLTLQQTGGGEGRSVAINEDYIVTGKPRAQYNGQINVGLVNVYDTKTLNHQLSIWNPGTSFFGTTVALSRSILVVGNTYGTAYVFDLASANPSEHLFRFQHTVQEPFPSKIAIDGDIVVIGNPYDGSVGFLEGIIYVHDLSSSDPEIPIATITNPDPGGPWFNLFGSKVGVSGRKVIANSVTSSHGGFGAVYLFDMDSPTLGEPELVFTHPRGLGDYIFGADTAISGDRVLINVLDQPTAYLYDLSSMNPEQPVGELTAPFPPNSLSMTGDLAVVTAYGAESALVFEVTTPVATQVIEFLDPYPNSINEPSFGKSFAIHESRVVIGDQYENLPVDSNGGAYVFDISDSEPID